MSTGKLFLFAVIFAFASGICFMNDNSAFQDAHHLGYTFIIAGIVFGAIAGYFIVQLAKGNKQ